MTVYYPEIIFNSSTGSDSAASGAGPSTAVTGTSSAHTGGIASTTITFTNTPDLSGVSVDGSAALWLNTASGRQWSRITAKDNTAKTVTVEDSFTIASGSAVSYAIGGKRATFNETNSRKLFTADAKANWVVTTETDQTISSALTVTSVGSPFIVRGSTETNHKVITQSANTNCFGSGVPNLTLMNLKFQCTNATRTSAGAYAGTGGNGVKFINCIIGDTVNRLAYAASGIVNNLCLLVGCYVNVTATAISTSATSSTVYIENTFAEIASGQTFLSYGSSSQVQIRRSIFKGGANVVSASQGDFTLINSVFFNQSTSAITSAALSSGRVENCIFHSCGIPLNFPSVQSNNGLFVNRNVFYNSSSNQNVPSDPYQITSDPQFVNTTTNNFDVGIAAKGLSYPFNLLPLGILSSTQPYFDLGSSQAQTSGGGLLLPRPMNGGYSA